MRDAFAKGYAEGERQGALDARDRVDASIARLNDSLEAFAAHKTQIMRRSERELVQLAVAMAEQIVGRAVATDPELLAAMARVAIDRVNDTGAVASIRLHPLDYAALTAARNGEPIGGAIELAADATLERGACIAQLAHGEIDVSVDAQIRELARALLGEGGDDHPDSHGRTTDW